MSRLPPPLPHGKGGEGFPCLYSRGHSLHHHFHENDMCQLCRPVNIKCQHTCCEVVYWQSKLPHYRRPRVSKFKPKQFIHEGLADVWAVPDVVTGEDGGPDPVLTRALLSHLLGIDVPEKITKANRNLVEGLYHVRETIIAHHKSPTATSDIGLDPDQRRAAVELLDNLLPCSTKAKRRPITPAQEAAVEELMQDVSKWFEVPQQNRKDACRALFKRLAAGCSDALGALKAMADPLVKRMPSIDQVGQFADMVANGIAESEEGDTGARIMRLVLQLKPTLLTMVCQNHINSISGWMVTITALIEMYSDLPSALSWVSDILHWCLDQIEAISTTTYQMFSKWVSGLFKAEGLSDWLPHLCALFGLLYLLIVGRVPTQGVTTALTKVTQLFNGHVNTLKNIKWLSDWFKQNAWANKVRNFMVKSSALLDNLSENPSPDSNECKGLLSCIDIMLSEGEEVLFEIGNSPLGGVVRTQMDKLTTAQQGFRNNLALNCERNPPQAWIFTGPPGIGKTRLCHALAAKMKLATSTFTLARDHHDTYTNNPVAIWDEFDTDPKGDFVETMIGLVNSTPYPLNCDRVENKTKVFTSDIILCTSNFPCSVRPDHPRAGAFYRRITTVDVSAPAITDWVKKNPGKEPPPNLYASDFSHLNFSIRPHLGIDPGGNTLDGVSVQPTNCTFSGLVRRMNKRYKHEAAPVTAIWVKTKPELLQSVYDTLVGWRTWCGAGCCIEINPPAGWSPETNLGARHIIIAGTDMPQAWAGCVQVNVTGHRKVMGNNYEIHRRNTHGNPFDTLEHYPSVRSPIMRDVAYGIDGVEITLSDQLPPHLTIPYTRVVYVTNIYNIIGGLYRHACIWSISGTAKALMVASKGLANWIDVFHCLKDITWTSSPCTTLFRTPTGDILFSTYGKGMRVLGLIGRIRVTSFTDQQPSLRSMFYGYDWWDTLHRLAEAIASKWTVIGLMLLTLTNVTYMLKRSKRSHEAKGKTKHTVRGARSRRVGGLSDEEYDEWKDIQRDWRREMTIQDWLALRERAAAGGNDAEAQRFRAWFEVRALRMANRAYNYEVVDVIGKQGHRVEVHRTTQLRAGQEERDFDAPFVPEGVTAVLGVFDADGARVGWATHVGNGRLVSAAHLFSDGTIIQDCPEYDIVDTVYDTIYIKTKYKGPAYPTSDGDPAFFGLTKHPVRNVLPGTYDTSSTRVDGWMVQITTGLDTKAGDCGLPYFNLRGGVCGVHSASSTDRRDKLVSKVAQPKAVEKSIVWKGLKVAKTGVSVGSMPTGTRYHRSPAAKSHPPEHDTHAPAPFGRGDQRYSFSQTEMLVNGLRPYQETPVLPFKANILRAACNDSKAYLRSVIGTHKTPNLTYSSAQTLLDSATSCGPHVPGLKKDYLNDEGKYIGMLEEHFGRCWDEAQRGVSLPHDYKLALKDELRPVEKCAEGKRRLLWGADAGVTLIANAAFAGVAERLKSTVPMHPVCVGINMDSAQSQLLSDACQLGHVYNLDYTKWDSTMQPVVIASAVDIMADFAEDSALTSSAAATLKSPANGYIDDVKFTTVTGLPSGMPFTSQVNSICHMILFAYCVRAAYDQANVPYSSNVFNTETIFTYGDDGLYVLTEATHSLMPQIVGEMCKVGLKPTSPDKSPTITEVSGDPVFLKRSLHRDHRGRCWARLDKSSLMRQCYWVKAQNTLDVTLPPHIDQVARAQQLDNVCIYASQWDDSTATEIIDLVTTTAEVEGVALSMNLLSLARAEYEKWYCGLLQGQSQENPEASLKKVFVMEGDERPSPGASAPGLAGPEDNGPLVVTAPQPVAPVQAAAMAAATGSLPSSLPPEVQATWVTLTNITWNTRQGPNTLLGALQLGPGLNPYVAHLSQMWTAWGGSMLVRLTVSGSGLYGGRLLAAVLPPGVNTADVNNPGAFPHVLIDARQTEPFTITIPDIRPTDFHVDGDNIPTCSVGLWVFNPLINPFGGNAAVVSQVYISVETKPGPDFDFAMLKPPNQRTTAGEHPRPLLPRRLGTSRGNRTGGFVSGGLIVQQWDQVNHHWDVDSVTYGWSVGPVSPLVCNIDTGNLTNGVVTVDADGKGPIMVNIPNNFPDFCASTANSTGTSPSSWHTAAGPLNTFDDHWDVAEHQVWNAVACVSDNPGTNAGTITLASQINAANMCLVRNYGQQEHTSGTNAIFTPTWLQGQASVNPSVTPVYSVNRAYGPAGPNQIFLWCEEFLRDYPQRSVVYCSQLGLTANLLEHANYYIPQNNFAVWQVDTGGNTFQLGMTRTGVFYTGGAAGTTVNLTPETTFEFVGFFPISTALMGPVSATGFRHG
nr:ORF1 protein [Sapovirus sp.]